MPYPGGMLDHGLEIVAYSLKLRQSHLLPIGANPCDQAASRSSGLLPSPTPHCCTTSARSPSICTSTGRRQHLASVARPTAPAIPLPLHRDDREYRYSTAPRRACSTGNCFDREVLDWLSGYPSLWAPLLYVLAGSTSTRGAGRTGGAGRPCFVAQELGGDPDAPWSRPARAATQAADGLRYLLKEELKLKLTRSLRWLAHRGWFVAGEQDGLGQAARAHLLSQGIGRHSCEQHRRVQRAAGPRMPQPTPTAKRSGVLP